MASRDDQFDHIVREFLQAQIDSLIGIHLRDENITTLRKLRQYLRKPGLDTLQWRDIGDGDQMKDFPDDMKEDLRAIASYLAWVQYHFGPTDTCQFDYTLKTRGDFDDYVGFDFNLAYPVS